MKYLSFLLPLLIVVLLAGCGTTDLLGNFNLISDEREQALGEELSKSIAEQENLVTDPVIHGYVEGIGRRLVSVSQTPHEPRFFYVLKKDEVNAFAIPGGHMYIQTGLIEAAETEAELAAVIAHELAHAEKRHPTQQLSRQMGTQFLFSIIMGENPSRTQEVVSTIMTTSGISAYSRSAEFEADRIGTWLLNRAGYDPSAMSSFFKKLVDMEKQQSSGGMRNLFASHPPTTERIDRVDGLVLTFNPRSTKTAVIGNLAAIQSKIQQLP
jgi:beta-barrel assembly-enhancing protease